MLWVSLVCSWWRWRQAASGGGKQALTGAPGTLSLSLSPTAGEGWTSTPLLGTAARPGLSGTWPLGNGGLVFAGGCFQVAPEVRR